MVHLRRFTEGDLPRLTRAIDTVCAEGRWMRTARFEPDAGWKHALAYPDCPCHLLLVAEDSGNIVGWCRAFPADAEEAAITLGLGLLPSHRDRGIGSAMMRQALDWARRAGYQQAYLTAYADNARAIHVFSRHGFEFAGAAIGGLLHMTCDLIHPGAVKEGGRS